VEPVLFLLPYPLLTTPGRIRQCPRRRRLPPHHVVPLNLRPRHPDIRLQPRLFLRRPLHHLHRRFTRSSTRDYAWIHNHRHWSHHSSVKLLCCSDDGRTHRRGCRDGNEYSHRRRMASRDEQDALKGEVGHYSDGELYYGFLDQ
jgi:hypothetical protein